MKKNTSTKFLLLCGLYLFYLNAQSFGQLQKLKASVNSDTICKGMCASLYCSPSGGTPPYTCTWSSGQVGEKLFFCPYNAGTATILLTVKDSNGDTATALSTILTLPELRLDLDSTNVSCFGETDGTATTTVIGGTEPYSYSWDIGFRTKKISNMSAGTYTVNVTDAHNCQASESITILEPSEISLTTSSTNSFCTATVDVSGGTGNYLYSWNTVPSQSTQTIKNLSDGSYTVTVEDANKCSKTATVKVSECLVTSVAEENAKNYFIVSPNPVNSSSVLQLHHKEILLLSIYNAFGELIEEEENISQELWNISKDNYKPGIYFIKIKTSSENYTSRFMVE